MKKIKDLIYDYNDIFVALLIIALAGAIIVWRVTGIMAYPEYMAGKEQTQTGDVDFSDVDLTPGTVDEFNENPDDITTQPPEEGEGQGEGEGEGQGEQPPVDTPDDGGDKPDDRIDANGNFIVEIPRGASAFGIAKILKEQGVISDETAFLEKVTEMGAELKMKYGTYKIPQGSSAEEIINILM